MNAIRERVAQALHADRDHTRDGVNLGHTPICNCYELADRAIAALGGVKDARQYGTYTSFGDGEGLMELDYASVKWTRDPKWHTRQQISYATEWTAEDAA